MTEVVDPKRRARIRAIHRRLDVLRAAAARTLWEYGSLFAEVERDALWREDGASSFYNWLEESAGVSRETGRKAILIAQHFNEEMAARFGTEKLAAAVRYLEATGKQEAAGDLVAAQLRLRGDGGRFYTVPFVEASYRQVVAATQLLLEAQERPVPTEPDVHARVEALRSALPAAPAGTGRGERVKVLRGTDGRVALSFQAVPLDELEAFVTAVRAHFLDNKTP